jgi:ABC-type sugar transport system substrate-binding protein
MKRLSLLTAVLTCAFLAACNKPASPGTSSSSAEQKLTIAFLPKSKGNAYFVACKKGADEAAKELGVELIFDGPTQNRSGEAE